MAARSPRSSGGLPYPTPVSRAVSAVMRGNRSRDTKPEVQLRSLLHARGLRFRVNRRIQASGLQVRPDIVFNRYRVAVFVDGCFWHSCREHGISPQVNKTYWLPKLKRVAKRDRVVGERLSAAGWSVIRIWEHTPPNMAADVIKGALRSR